ncbi:MAG: carbon storage regulator [Planctomycetes bacterium]|nr:carbon storage regulator [Planctomycetota bacterium]
MIAHSFGQEVLHMLVITRREGEEVVIGNPASPIGTVRVAAIKGDRVRLAFAFPREIDVHRREIADEILAAKSSVVGSIRPAAREAT